MATAEMAETKLQRPQVDWHRHDMPLPDRGGAMSYLLCETAGPSAPVLVFAHANGFHGLTYSKVFEGAAQDYRVILLDLRGHGQSTLPAPVEALKNWHIYLDDVLAFLDSFGEESYVLAGHSLGGVINFLAGQRRPERTAGLLLAEPVLLRRSIGKIMSWGHSVGLTRRLVPLVRRAAERKTRFDDREAAFWNYHGRGAFKTWPDSILRDYVDGGFRDHPDGYVELACDRAWEVATYQTQDNDIWKHAHRARFPIHVLRAERGSTVFPMMADRLKRILPQTIVETVPGTSHFLPMERPDALATALSAMA